MITRKHPVFVLMTLVAAGCGANEDSQDTAAAGDAATSTAAAPATTAPAAQTPPVVTFTAKDYAFEGPTEIPAGVTTLQLVNQGPELHHATLVKLDQGKTANDFVQALKPGAPPPQWATEMGGPNAPAPGETANATQTLQPGNYALICFIPSPDGTPHMMKGMVHNFRVTPSNTASAAEPQADIVMRLDDYKFDLSKPITAGKRTFKVENVGPQHHEVELVQLAPGKTAKDMIDWIHKPQGPPPGKPIGGIAGTVSNTHAYFTADIAPGEYALICFLPDAKDGKAHFEHGMIQQITVS